jgi:hypothetical protein
MSLDLDNLFTGEAARGLKDENKGIIYFFVRHGMTNIRVKKGACWTPARFMRRQWNETVCNLQRVGT